MSSEIPCAAEFPSHGSGIVLLGIDGVVHLAHFRVGNLPAQYVQSAAQLLVVAKSATPKNGDGLVRREKMAVILQDDHSEGGDEPVRGTAGDHIHLMFLERSVEQAEIHDAGGGGELQSV